MSIIRPTNKMETILNFVSKVNEHGAEITNFWSAYPDATILWGGTIYRVEFEYRLSSFIKHGHDPFQCNIIICWENNSPIKFPITVWEICKRDYPNYFPPDEEKLFQFKKMIDKKKEYKPMKYPKGSSGIFDRIFNK